MPIDSAASIQITALSWVPDFARGFVRDLRPRWACEEIGLAYRERLLHPLDKPESYYRDQPWGQVPHLLDGAVSLFESGAILLHLGEKDERLLPRAPQARASALSWTLAAFNSVEPAIMELSNVDLFSNDQEWARLRRPSLVEQLGKRFDRLATGLGTREWLAGSFSIADIAMATVLREAIHDPVLTERPVLADYVARAIARPAFERAMAAQLAAFKEPQGEAA